MERIRPTFLLPFRLLGISTMGWILVLGKMGKKIALFFLQKKGIEKIFFLSLLIQVLTSGFWWVKYSIQFQGTTETIYTSVNWNIYFVLGSACCFFFTGFWKSSWVWPLFLLIQSGILLLLGVGFYSPIPYLVGFLRRSDFEFTLFFYIFSLSSILNFILGTWVFFQERRDLPESSPTKEEV